ncbi:TetR/AcrR family transcriptional regulator [Bacillus sp. SD088]|uniref:TetR/AcrR family transcriptional regulator n=1 Tax=Bacillus sp. SD088 TaxID=2782012 RepID=UPI001A95AC6C|nr:TetR/AcrR family transcriptional regulator [Bacillus sp. SD088]MBO0993424.1 TetR/AcrR family transcriptional regulator [Bacillus sp. SD088]
MMIDKRIQRSKKALKEIFIQLLAQKPFDQITITEIVRTAGYNRGTFYSHFETKENLLQEIIQETLHEMIKEIRQPYKELKRVNMKELQAKDLTFFHYFEKNAQLFNMLLSDHLQVDFRYQMAKAIEELFIEGYQYEIKEETQLDPKWLYIYRSHGIAGLVIRWIEDGFSPSSYYMSEQIIELMLIKTEVFQVKN